MRIIPLYPKLLWSLIGSLVGFGIPIAAQAQAETPEGAPLEFLIEATERLKKKTISEAYFSLDSPQAPRSTLFTPDTKGSGFVIIAKYLQLGKNVDWSAAKKLLTNEDNSSRAPIPDRIHHRLVYYTDAEWQQLSSIMQSWMVPKDEITGIAFTNQWLLQGEIIALRIPSGDTGAFFDALLRAWGTTKEKFRCFTHWN